MIREFGDQARPVLHGEEDTAALLAARADSRFRERGGTMRDWLRWTACCALLSLVCCRDAISRPRQFSKRARGGVVYALAGGGRLVKLALPQ